MDRAIHDGRSCFERVDQASETRYIWCCCPRLHILRCIAQHLGDVVPPIVMHVGLEGPGVLPSLLPQWPIEDYNGLNGYRSIAQLLAVNLTL